MTYGSPCPFCGAPVGIGGEEVEVGAEGRCSSCGYRLQVAIVDGAVTLTPAAIVVSRLSKRNKKKFWADVYATLPILLPLACIGVVVVAIAIREYRESGERRKDEQRLAAANEGKKVTAPKKVVTKQNVETERRPPTQPALKTEDVRIEPAQPVMEAVALQVAAATDPPEAGEAPIPAEKPKPFDEVAVFKDLREAKQKFRERISTDMPRLVDEAQEIVKQEAKKTGDLEQAKQLLKELSELKDEGKLPTSRQFDGPRSRHIELRRAAASELYGVYKSTIDVLVKDLQIDQAILTKDEMQEFVEKERKVLGIAAPSAADPAKTVDKTSSQKPLVIDLQQDRQVREYDDPDPILKVLLAITELTNFPEGAKLRGEESTALAGKPLIIEFAYMAGAQIEVRCVRNPTTRKIQLQVEPVFLEGANKEFELTFTRLDNLEAGVRTNLARVQDDIPTIQDQMADVRSAADAQQSQISEALRLGRLNALQADAARKQASSVANNKYASLERKLANTRQQLPKLAARLSAVPEVRSFMESIHQEATIKYTISIERDGKQVIIVDARQ